MKKYKTKILIFGGSGFIGYHLAKKCIKKGWSVTSVSRNLPKKEKILKKVIYSIKNLENFKNFKNISKDYDFVVNASGYINNNNNLTYKNHNFKIVKNIIRHFRNTNIKAFLNIGSSAEYGGVFSLQNEKLKTFPKSKYGKDKLKCTKLLINSFKTINFPAIVFRTYQVYGPLQDTNRLIPIAAKACYFNKKFDCSDGSQIRDYIYIDDLTEAIIKALNNNLAIGQIFNIGSGDRTALRYIINYTKKFFKKGHPVFGKIKLRKDENKKIIADISKIKSILKWKPKVNFKVGLNRTLKYYKKKYQTIDNKRIQY